MPTYSYTGVDRNGQRASGVVEAFDEIEAMTLARDYLQVVSSIKEVRKGGGLLQMQITKPHIKMRSLALVCNQLALILKAGMSAPRAMKLVADQLTDKTLKGIFTEVAADVAAGHGLADSLESKGSDLPRVLIETVRSGEESGRLPESFERLHKYFDKRSKVASKVAAAMAYPLFVACIAVVVVAVMMIMVIPTILQLVESLGTDVPAITQFLIDSAAFLGTYWPVFLVVFVVAAIGIRAWGKTEQGKKTLSNLALSLPVLSPINVNGGAALFSNTMATLLISGIPTARAVDITSRVMTNHVLSQEVGRMTVGLNEGRSLGECMESVTKFPPTLVEMTSIGEQTGSLEETLESMGDYYDAETQRYTDKALAMLEPAMLIVMAAFAGFIVIALYLPMFTMYAAM